MEKITFFLPHLPETTQGKTRRLLLGKAPVTHRGSAQTVVWVWNVLAHTPA